MAAMTTGRTPSSSGGSQSTCIACRLLFATADEQRDHYHTDLHRFNLKRRVAALPAVTQAQYQSSVQAQQQPHEHERLRLQQRRALHCAFCRRTFNSQATLEQHFASRRHLERAALAAQQPHSDPEAATDDSAAAADSRQPQAPAAEPAIDAAAAGAESAVDGSRPAADAAAGDASGAQQQQRRRVEETDAAAEEETATELCLFCEFRARSNQQALVHMSRRHGFFVPDVEYLRDVGGLLRFLQTKVRVYFACVWCERTFASTLAVQQHMDDSSHCKLAGEGGSAEQYAAYYDFSRSWDEAGLPADGDDDETETRALEAVQQRAVRLAADGYGLILADGRQIGHRELRVYYRQSFAAPLSRESILINRLQAAYRQLGWTTDQRPGGVQRQRPETQRHLSDRLRLGMKNNNQLHFRCQIDF